MPSFGPASQHVWYATIFAAASCAWGASVVQRQPGAGATGQDAVVEAEPFQPQEFSPEDRRVLVGKLVAAIRKLNLATPAVERSKLIAEWLSDEYPEVKLVGLELAARELAAANSLSPDVSQSATKLLRDRAPAIRAAAASLLAQLSGADPRDELLAALSVESDSGAAASMLKLACRWPRGESAPIAIAWLTRASPGVEGASAWRWARDAALDLAWNLLRAGELNPTSTQEVALAAAREIPLTELGPSGCLLISWLGTPADRTRLGELLLSADAGQRLAAAESLVVFEEHLDGILRAAALDPQLIELSIRGVILHRQTEAGFSGIAAITNNRPEVRRSALSRVARFLSARDVLVAASGVGGEPAVREIVLADLARSERILAERVDSGQREAITLGLEALARLRLELDKPGAAVAAIDALETVGELAESARALKAKAFISLNRPDDAGLLRVPPGIWIDSLADLIGRPSAADILDYIDARIAPSFDEGQVARLEQLRAKIVLSQPVEPAPSR